MKTPIALRSVALAIESHSMTVMVVDHAGILWQRNRGPDGAWKAWERAEQPEAEMLRLGER